MTKLDVLDEFDTIPVCVGYRAGGRDLLEMPPRVAGMEKVEPVYECLPGWQTSTFGMSAYDELPPRAKDYLAFLEEQRRRRGGLHLHRTRAQPDHRTRRFAPGSPAAVSHRAHHAAPAAVRAAG